MSRSFNGMLESYGTDAYDICAGRHRGNEESEMAFDGISPEREKLYRRVLRAIDREPHYQGLTCEEISIRTGIAYTTCSARLSEMKRDGILEKIGTRATRSGSKAAVLAPKSHW